jgi:hypothetical protein
MNTDNNNAESIHNIMKIDNNNPESIHNIMKIDNNNAESIHNIMKIDNNNAQSIHNTYVYIVFTTGRPLCHEVSIRAQARGKKLT